MERTIFNEAQLQILNMMSRIKTAEELNELRDVISDYYAHKAQKEIDSLWEKGVLNHEKLDEIRHEHLRTPYKE